MTKVLTEQELYDIECAIYNDDNEALFKSLPQGVEDLNDGGIVKELAQGQECYILPQTNIMLRQDGRVFNVRFIRALKPMWTPHDILLILNGKQIRYTGMYKKMGWKFDHTQITKMYVDNNWGLTVSKSYRPVLKDFIANL